MSTLSEPGPKNLPDTSSPDDASAGQVGRSFPAGAAALGAGALVAFSMPPWGWWPLAFLGIAIYRRLTTDCSRRAAIARAFLFALGWFAPATGWVWFLTAPGYPFVVLIFATYHAVAAAVAPRGRWRWLGVPAAHTLAEAVRFCFPFGGIPLASLAINQSQSAIVSLAPWGGAILITWATFQIGFLFGAVPLRRLGGLRVRAGQSGGAGQFDVAGSGRRSRLGLFRLPTELVVGLAIAVVVLLASSVPDGTRATGEQLEVAFVQGGGPQGTRAIHTSSRTVVERHLAATALLDVGPDLVVWPENVIDVDTFTESIEREEVAAEAARLGAPFLVGVTEEVPDRSAFTNSQIVVAADGSVGDRYDKVRRVPFGEYMPLRGLLDSLGAPVDQVPRDAVGGVGPAYLDTPVGRVAVVISWEVFFGGRARDGTSQGGQLVINPTNGSSYTGTILQTQQVASSRLRARETGRWVVQVSPTGFSAFISPDGEVFQRTGVSEQAVRSMTVELREGRTLYNRIGDIPIVFLAAVTLLVAQLAARRGSVQPA